MTCLLWFQIELSKQLCSTTLVMANFEIEGKLLKKFEMEWEAPSIHSREFVIEIIDELHPQCIKFQLTQESCYFLDAFEEGETIKVFFDLKGVEHEGKYMTILQALSIEKGSLKRLGVFKYQSEFDRHSLQNCPPSHYRELKMTSYRFVFQDLSHENNFFPAFLSNPARVSAKADSVSKCHGWGYLYIKIKERRRLAFASGW